MPAAKCVELKSLKLYLQQFRNEGIFYEHVTNTILDDLVAATKPRAMTIEADFNARGGMTETVTAKYAASVAALRAVLSGVQALSERRARWRFGGQCDVSQDRPFGVNRV